MQPYNNPPTDPWNNTGPNPSPPPAYIDPSAAYNPAINPDYQRRYKEASRRVQKKVNFYKTLTSYLIVCAFLWILALTTGSGFWPIWVMLGWGIGLAFMAVDAFALGISDDQRRQMIEDEMRRMNGPRY